MSNEPLPDEVLDSTAGMVLQQLMQLAPKRLAVLREDEPSATAERAVRESLDHLLKKAGCDIPEIRSRVEGEVFENGTLRPDVEAAVLPAGAPASNQPSGAAPSAPTSSAPPSSPPAPSRRGTAPAVAPAPAPAPVKVPESVLALFALRKQMRAAFLERDTVIDSILVAAMCGEHVLLLGPPGTAKTACALAFAKAAKARTFVRLLTRHTTQEEIFGPPSLPDLKKGNYVRKIEGFLPTAKVGVIDEIFKCNSAILNSLLTILNERAYDNGTERISVPLRLALGASNELPEDESLAALYDRFMFRHWVQPVSAQNMSRLLTMPDPVSQIDEDQIDLDALREVAKATVVGDDVVSAIVVLRQQLAQEGILASDRRWRKCMGIVQSAAVLRGVFNADSKATAIVADMTVLSHVLWDNPDDAERVRAIVTRVVGAQAKMAPKPAAPQPPPRRGTAPTQPQPQPQAKPVPAPPVPPAAPPSFQNLPSQPYGGSGAPPTQKGRATPAPTKPSGGVAAAKKASKAASALRGQTPSDPIREEIATMEPLAGFTRLRSYVEGGMALKQLLPALEQLARNMATDSLHPFANKRQVNEWLQQARAAAAGTTPPTNTP